MTLLEIVALAALGLFVLLCLGSLVGHYLRVVLREDYLESPKDRMTPHRARLPTYYLPTMSADWERDRRLLRVMKHRAKPPFDRHMN
ncbi:hypothetical protein LCGC14_1915230 [marine sediment metagenome]|uniref:Uncharacterized protein n=1 Tax=marine sediment metagenome TaxID=412755 RepID=A0A0F9I6F5_9ZZZZ